VPAASRVVDLLVVRAPKSDTQAKKEEWQESEDDEWPERSEARLGCERSGWCDIEERGDVVEMRCLRRNVLVGDRPSIGCGCKRSCMKEID